jgi:hypothetical protein
MQSSEDLGNVFGRSWQLLSENWIIIVPGIVIGIVAGLIIGALALMGIGAVAVAGGAGLGVAFIGVLIAMCVMLIASLLTIAYTTGMAGAAWQTGRATLGDGAAALSRNGGSILVAIVLLFLLGIVAAVLTIPTIGIVWLAYGIFFLYTFASVIIGGRTGSEAIAESSKIALRNFVTTLVVVVLIAIASWIGGIIGNLFHGVPVLGPIVRLLIQQIVVVYTTLVIVGEYAKLRLTVQPVAAGVPPNAPPPPPAT